MKKLVKLYIPDTIHEELEINRDKFGDKPYLWTKYNGIYCSKSYRHIVNDAQTFASYLLDAGLAGKNIMIFGENSYEWLVADFAIMSYIGISVCANKDWKEYDLINALKTVNIDMIIYSKNNTKIVKKISSAFPKLKSLDFDQILLKSNSIKQNIKDFAQNRNTPCKIVFTSGTTGLPKAVPLTFFNMISCGKSIYQRTPTDETDSYYLFLPLHHVYAGIAISLFSFHMGCDVYLCSNIHNMMDEIKQVKPTVFCCVPLVYERIYDSIDKHSMKKIRRALIISRLFLRLKIDVRKIIFAKLHQAFGGRIKYLYSGAAPLKNDIKQLFIDTGFMLIEGYGMTESSSSIAIEDCDEISIGTVGKPIDSVKLKIINIDKSGNGEIAIKGDSVFAGYYNNEDATSKAFDKDGYFHTGDIGNVDKSGNLRVIGRKEQTILTSNGELVSPGELEQLINAKINALKIKVFQRGNQIVASIYVNKKSKKTNYDHIINGINNQLPKYKRINDYSVNTIDKLSQLK